MKVCTRVCIAPGPRARCTRGRRRGPGMMHGVVASRAVQGSSVDCRFCHSTDLKVFFPAPRASLVIARAPRGARPRSVLHSACAYSPRGGSCAGARGRGRGRTLTPCCLALPFARGAQVNRANETIQCENCDRILEERYNDFRVVPVNIERESPYCVVPDDALAQHKSSSRFRLLLLARATAPAPSPRALTFVAARLSRRRLGRFEDKLEGDPYYASGFITAFSQISVQQQGAFTLTARTFAGELAELERILGDLDLEPPVRAASAVWLPTTRIRPHLVLMPP